MKLQELFQTEPICERGDISKIVKGSIAYHGFLGPVKILNILGAIAEVAQLKGGKHARVQMTSLSADDLQEDTDLEEALEFAHLHLNAFKAHKTQFAFQGKQYKVKLNSDTDVKSLEKKIEELDTRSRSKNPRT